MTFRRMASTTWGAGTTGKPTWPRRALQREKRGVIWRKRVAWDAVSRIFWGETAGKFTDRRQKGDRNDAEPSNNGITLTHWNVIETSLWHNHKKHAKICRHHHLYCCIIDIDAVVDTTGGKYRGPISYTGVELLSQWYLQFCSCLLPVCGLAAVTHMADARG